MAHHWLTLKTEMTSTLIRPWPRLGSGWLRCCLAIMTNDLNHERRGDRRMRGVGLSRPCWTREIRCLKNCDDRHSNMTDWSEFFFDFEHLEGLLMNLLGLCELRKDQICWIIIDKNYNVFVCKFGHLWYIKCCLLLLELCSPHTHSPLLSSRW